MLQYVKGCLIDALVFGEVDAIGHQANCFCRMGSGVAKDIRNRLPQAVEADMMTSVGDRRKLGTFTVGHSPYGPVYNLYGQYNYGYDGKQYTIYEALRGALMNMRDDLPKFAKIGFPKMGAGLAGGDWDTIAGIIEDVFKDGQQVTIYLKD